MDATFQVAGDLRIQVRSDWPTNNVMLGFTAGLDPALSHPQLADAKPQEVREFYVSPHFAKAIASALLGAAAVNARA